MRLVIIALFLAVIFGYWMNQVDPAAFARMMEAIRHLPKLIIL